MKAETFLLFTKYYSPFTIHYSPFTKQMKVFAEAIMTKFNSLTLGAHNTFWIDVNGKLFLNEAPQGTVGKYAVFSITDEEPEYYFGGERLENLSLQFDLYSSASNSSVLLTYMMQYLWNLFDDCALIVTGYDHYICQRTNSLIDRFAEDNIYHGMTTYDIIEGA